MRVGARGLRTAVGRGGQQSGAGWRIGRWKGSLALLSSVS